MILDQFRLDGKTALVTGCRRGIGKGFAEALAAAGADIIGVSANLAPGSDVQRAVEKTGRTFYPYSCDFSDRKALYDFIGKVREECPHVDILFNNAGMVMRADAEAYPDDYWDKVVETDLSAQFILAREFGARMLQKGGGKIVFTCSLLSYQGGIRNPAYAASKAGVKELVMALSNEWASRHVNVNGIAPGYIATDNTQTLRDDPARSAALLERIPAGRYGTPEDLQGAAVFLASQASDYIHGSVILVDGGWMGR
ncbi:MAG: SDR family oxidoreductase [Victivallaceae bacterium]|nr:SDR family oxidoreductase [Victivallaceae bacterium]